MGIGMVRLIAALAIWNLSSTLALAYSPLALAEITADEILQKYDQADPALRVRIEDTFDGMARAFLVANTLLLARGKEPLYCQPMNLALSGNMTMEILRREVSQLPALGKGAFSIVTLTSLQVTFPCPK